MKIHYLAGFCDNRVENITYRSICSVKNNIDIERRLNMSELSTLLANQQGLLERLKVLDGVGAGRKKMKLQL